MLRRADLVRLADKYGALLELRRAPPAAPAAVRGTLRALAAEFPGSLRELDALPLEELERRRAAVERARDGGETAPWMEWIHRLHATTRLALAVKRRLPARGALSPAAAAELATRVGAELGVPCSPALVAEVAERWDGRLGQLAARRVERDLALAPGTLVSALFR